MIADERRYLRIAGALGAAVSLFEIGADAALLQIFFALSAREVEAAILALAPAVFIALVWWVLFPRRWLRPVRQAIDDRAKGLSISQERREAAREALVHFTRRTLLHRSFAMLVVAFILGPTLSAATELGAGAAATIAGVTVVVSFWCNTLRAFLYRRTLEPLHEILAGEMDPLRIWARSVRERLFVGPYLLGGLGVLFIGVHTYLVVGLPLETFANAFVTLPPLLASLGLGWGLFLFRSTRKILRFAGPSREDPSGALLAAQSLPYSIGFASLGVWGIAAIMLSAGYALRGTRIVEALQIAAGILAVAAASVVLNLLWHRQILAPVVEAAMLALGDATVTPRSRLGLYGRLIVAPLGLVIFAGTFAFMTTYNEHEQVLFAEAERSAQARLAERYPEFAATPGDLTNLCKRLQKLRAAPEILFLAKGPGILCSTQFIALPAAVTDALRLRDEASLTIENPRGAIAFRTFGNGSAIGVFRPMQVLPQEGVKGTPALLFVFATLGLVSMGLVWLLAHDVAVPLRRLTNAAKRIGEGDLRTPVAIAADDEVADLAHVVERMRRQLAGKIAELEELNRSLEARVRARTADLQDANSQVTTAMMALAEAQDRIIGQEKMASIGRLVAGIAHEINNPLNFVSNALPPIRKAVEDLRAILAALERCEGQKGHALEAAVGEALREKRSREIEDLGEADDLLRLMQTGVIRMAGIVRALRDFSRIDRPDEPPQLFDLSRLIDDSLALLRHDLHGRVEVQRQEEIREPILGHAGPLGQVLVNLIKNGAQAIEGTGVITIATRNIASGVEIDVADSGAGIPAEVLPKIFEPFFTTKPVGAGTGLGLSIVHGILEREGGKIRIASKPGETRFTIFLPG